MTAAAKLYYAMRILKVMNEGLRNGNVQTIPMLSAKLRIGFDTLELILEELSRVKIVRKLAGKGWAMVRDVQHIQVSELYRLFVFNLSSMTARQDDAKIHQWLIQMEQRVAETATTTLLDLF